MWSILEYSIYYIAYIYIYPQTMKNFQDQNLIATFLKNIKSLIHWKEILNFGNSEQKLITYMWSVKWRV